MFEETQTMSEDGIRKKLEHRDFFVSYTSSDQQWAEWRYCQLGNRAEQYATIAS